MQHSDYEMELKKKLRCNPYPWKSGLLHTYILKFELAPLRYVLTA